MISERLRDIANDDDLGPGTTEVRVALHEAADVIDALVAVAERVANEGQKGRLSLHTLMECANALAMARRK